MSFNSSVGGLNTAQSNQITEIERHLHNYERWFGAAVTPSGETHVADRIGTTTTAFVADAGNVTWGQWLQVLGSADTPADTGKVKFDLHRIEFVATERTQTHFVQLAFGATGAAALTAGTYTEFAFTPGTPQVIPEPVDIISRRQTVGTKAWVRVFVPTQNTGTMSFYIGLHEYEV